jgi:hypothetical protein
MADGKTLIVLLAYKSNQDWLGVTMASVANQTRGNFRCVVADSTPDDSPVRMAVENVGRSWDADPRFVYQHYAWQPHADVAWKVNQAATIHGADCDYITILSDDDYLAPRFLEAQSGDLDADPMAGFAQGGVHFFGDRYGFWLHDLPLDLSVASQVGQNQFSGTCVMRMAQFREFGGYDVDSVPPGFPVGLEDMTLFIHFLRAGWRYTNAREVLFFARQRPDQNSRKLYGTDLYFPLLTQICRKQGIEVHITQTGQMELRYNQVVRGLS